MGSPRRARDVAISIYQVAAPAFLPVAANLPGGQRFPAADLKHIPSLATHRNHTRCWMKNVLLL
jgi:hypothetical protein